MELLRRGKRNNRQEAPKYAIPVLAMSLIKFSQKQKNKGGLAKNLESSKSIVICEFPQVITAPNRRFEAEKALEVH